MIYLSMILQKSTIFIFIISRMTESPKTHCIFNLRILILNHLHIVKFDKGIITSMLFYIREDVIIKLYCEAIFLFGWLFCGCIRILDSFKCSFLNQSLSTSSVDVSVIFLIEPEGAPQNVVVVPLTQDSLNVSWQVRITNTLFMYSNSSATAIVKYVMKMWN